MRTLSVVAAATGFVLRAHHQPTMVAPDTSVVPRADFERLQAELLQTQDELASTKARLNGINKADSEEERWAPDKVSAAFDQVDDNNDGVLTIDEFRKGYALLTGDAVLQAFETMDSDGNGTLDRSEFADGFALLASDSARAEKERQKVEQAVSEARVTAVQEAAKNLAEAQLMDNLFGEPPPGKSRWDTVDGYKPMPGRQPLRRNGK